jgi:hypothetical protein
MGATAAARAATPILAGAGASGGIVLLATCAAWLAGSAGGSPGVVAFRAVTKMLVTKNAGNTAVREKKIFLVSKIGM